MRLKNLWLKRSLIVLITAGLFGLLGLFLYFLQVSAPVVIITFIITVVVSGIILVIIIDSHDTTLGVVEALEETLNVKVLGIIPQTNAGKIISCLENDTNGRSRASSPHGMIDLAVHFAPRALISESFRFLRTIVLSYGGEERIKTLTITSAYPQEGKSMVSVNLAVSLAQAGIKTLLVEADLRRPRFAEIFGIEEKAGLVEIVLGKFPWRDTVKTINDIIIGKMNMDDVMLTPGLGNLNIITSGGVPSNPAELIGSEGFKNFLKDVKRRYDIVIFDSAPILAVADAAILAQNMDGVFLVHRIGSLSMGILKRAAAQLTRIKSNLIGIILNRTKSDFFPDFQGLGKKRPLHKGVHKRSILFFRGSLFFGALLVITAALLYLGGFFESVEKTEGEKRVTESKISLIETRRIERPEIDSLPVPEKIEPAPDIMPHQVVEGIEEVTEERKLVMEYSYESGAYPYSLYLGSYKTRERAESVVSSYDQRGISVVWVMVSFKDIGTWYRVYAGYFKERAQAEKFIEEYEIKDAEVKKTSYANLIGVFNNRDELDEMGRIIDDLGYSSYTIEGPVGIYNLFVGVFTTRSGAEEQNIELNSKGMESRVVER